MLGNYQVATQLVASRVVLSSIELGSYVFFVAYVVAFGNELHRIVGSCSTGYKLKASSAHTC
jgi:hypothetical protein